jgi:hypothetical protein
MYARILIDGRRIYVVLYCQLLIVVCRRRLIIVGIDYRSLLTLVAIVGYRLSGIYR